MVSAKTAVSSERLPGEGPASQLLRMVIGRIQLLVPTAMRDSSYLLAVGQKLPSLPCHTVLSTGWVMTWQPVWSDQDYKRSQRERASKKHITVFITQSWIWHPTTFATFYLLKASHQVQPSFKERAWIPGVRSHQEPCQKPSTASIWTPLSLFFCMNTQCSLENSQLALNTTFASVSLLFYLQSSSLFLPSKLYPQLWICISKVVSYLIHVNTLTLKHIPVPF